MEPVKIVIPAAVATFVRPGTPLEERLRGAEGQPDLSPREQLLLLFCLGKDIERQVAAQAHASMAALTPELICLALAEPGHHPALLHDLALLHGGHPKVRVALQAQPALASATRELLDTLAVSTALEEVVVAPLSPLSADGGDEDTDGPDQPNSSDPAGEELFSKYQLAQSLGIGEKIKMALTGDKEWRKILIKDPNKLVSSGVIKNPRISEPEVLTIIKSCSPNDEVMRLICDNKEWVKNYQIRKALIENPKTPLANALRYLGTMNEKDVAGYAKSRNISSVIATQAKRLLLNKKR